MKKGKIKMNENWTYTCPICKKQIVEKYSEDFVKEYIGATHDCPNCNGLLMINEDLSVKDFGAELVNSYKELGIDVTEEEATSSFISCGGKE